MFRMCLKLSFFDRVMVFGIIGILLMFLVICKFIDNNFWKLMFILNNVNLFGDELSYNLIFVILGIIDNWVGEMIKRVFVFCGELCFINSCYDGRILFVV